MSSASTLVSTFSPNLSQTFSQTFSPGTAYRAEAVARAERDLTASTDRYMRHAAHALALAAVRELRDAVGRVAGAGVILLIGGGHNGGDALLAGAFLAGRGCAVTAALATDHPHPTAMEAAERAGVRVAHEPLEACERAAAGGVALVIDGLTGIGATGPLRSRAAALVAPLRAAGRRGARPFRVVAVDLPSGTGVDDGAVAGPVLAADLSITFTCLKGAHLLPPAAGLCGRVEVADLGLPLPADPDAILVSRPADSELGRLLRVPGDTDHKYTRGVVGLWAGSRAYPGAAVLTASAAVRTGAGMVRLAAPQRVEDLVVAHRPEVVLASGRCQAAVIGPGTDPADIMRGAELDAVLMDLLGQHDDSYSSCSVSPGSRPAVIDAGALLLLAERLRGGVRCAPTHVLTPHAGEAAALLTTLGASISRTEVEAAPAACALDLARLTGGTVVLKGAPTLIAGPVSPAAPSGSSPEFSEPPESPESSAGSSGPAALRLLSVNAGPGWLATAGSGDVLAGILGAVLAAAQSEAERGGPAVAVSDCAALAVRLHAVAAELASGCRRPSSGRPLAALDLADQLPRACATVGGWAA